MFSNLKGVDTFFERRGIKFKNIKLFLFYINQKKKLVFNAFNLWRRREIFEYQPRSVRIKKGWEPLL